MVAGQEGGVFLDGARGFSEELMLQQKLKICRESHAEIWGLKTPGREVAGQKAAL